MIDLNLSMNFLRLAGFPMNNLFFIDFFKVSIRSQDA